MKTVLAFVSGAVSAAVMGLVVVEFYIHFAERNAFTGKIR